MKIYVVRHGETDWNTEMRLQGRTDIPLNAQGMEEAEKTSEALKSVPFSAVYVSPLHRARQTAEILKRDRRIPVYVDQRLIEMGFGIYEGKSSKNEKYLVPDKDFGYKFREKPSLYVPPEGGESFEEVCERGTDFLKELAADTRYQDDCVLVVAHGASIRGLLSSLCMNGDIDQFWGGELLKNCSVTVLDVWNGEIRLETLGQVLY